jgi:hypothetical protein
MLVQGKIFVAGAMRLQSLRNLTLAEFAAPGQYVFRE